MPEHTLAERLKDARSRTEREIAALDATEQGSGRKKPAKPPGAPREQVGTGRSSFNLDGAIAKIRAKIAATQDPALKARLEARIKALKDNAGQ